MNKIELFERLKDVPDDMVILIASDEEWNKLTEVYAADLSWVHGDTMMEFGAVSDKDVGDENQEYNEDEVQRAIILW